MICCCDKWTTESDEILLQVTKLEAARRQLETAIRLYFACGDEVSIHTLAGAAYALVRDINERRKGEPMLKDLHLFLPGDLAREFRTHINSPENFLKHADKDADAQLDFEPKWTEVLLWDASRKYCDLTGEQNKLLITFIFWFVAHEPELREHFEEECLSQGFSKEPLAFVFRLPAADRKTFFKMLN